MAMMADLLERFLRGDFQHQGLANDFDVRGTRPPDADAEKSATGVEIKPDDAQARLDIARNKQNIYDDKGNIVDFDWSGKAAGVFERLLNTFNGPHGDGTILGFIQRLMNPAPLDKATGAVRAPGKIGPDGSGETPGTGQDPALNPTPMKNQKMRQFRQRQSDRGVPNLPVPGVSTVPKDYSMPTALDPKAIEELRLSLLTQAGQLDPNNPNGLAGRMSGPYSKVDQQSQMEEAQGIADKVRNGYSSVTGKSPARPADFQSAIKNKYLGGE